ERSTISREAPSPVKQRASSSPGRQPRSPTPAGSPRAHPAAPASTSKPAAASSTTQATRFPEVGAESSSPAAPERSPTQGPLQEEATRLIFRHTAAPTFWLTIP